MSIAVAFTINAPAAQHELWRDDGTGLNFRVVATLDPGIHDHIDPDGTPGNTYKVRALGAGDPSAFASSGVYYIQDGAILLRSDDLSWYWVRLSTVGGTVELSIDQTPSAAPPFGLAHLIFWVAALGDFFKFELTTVNGVVGWQTDGNNPTGSPDEGINSIPLVSDDLLTYTVTLTANGMNLAPEINQTPVT